MLLKADVLVADYCRKRSITHAYVAMLMEMCVVYDRPADSSIAQNEAKLIVVLFNV